MRQRVELEALHAKALRRAREATDDAGVSRLLPDACSFGLDELLAGDLAGLTAELGTSPP